MKIHCRGKNLNQLFLNDLRPAQFAQRKTAAAMPVCKWFYSLMNRRVSFIPSSVYNEIKYMPFANGMVFIRH